MIKDWSIHKRRRRNYGTHRTWRNICTRWQGLDLGNYERYIGITLTRDKNITPGARSTNIWYGASEEVIICGRTVQVVPYITNAIIGDWIGQAARIPVDGWRHTRHKRNQISAWSSYLGETVRDIENAPFVSALRQLRRESWEMTTSCMHPFLWSLSSNGEQKTKPTPANKPSCASTKHRPESGSGK